MVRTLLVILTLVSLIDAPLALAATRPNVVIVIADDLGYGEPGCYGGREIPTPQLDQLARSGIRFTQAYVTASYCAASRAGLMTGRYQTRFGFENNPTGAQNENPNVGLPLQESTIGDHLRDAGYVTNLVGKWHLGGTATYHPQRRGFDHFFGFLHEGHYFVPRPWRDVTTWLRRKTLPDGSQGRWMSTDQRIVWSTHMGHREPDYDANNPILRDGQTVDEQKYLTDAFSREACQWIERYHEQPFLLVLAYNAVHSPLQAPDDTMQRFAQIADIHRRIFAGMLSRLDDGLGQVVDTLDKHGIRDNTLIVFVSDNGGPTRELTSSNRPLRGEKGSLYEGGIRVPMVISWPDELESGRVEHRFVSTLDILPTVRAAVLAAVLAAVGTEHRPRPLDGVNLLAYLKGVRADSPHRELYWRMGRRAALRAGDWKIVRPTRGAAQWELYNLNQDLAEANDVSRSHPDVCQDLIDRWTRLDQQMIPALW